MNVKYLHTHTLTMQVWWGFQLYVLDITKHRSLAARSTFESDDADDDGNEDDDDVLFSSVVALALLLLLMEFSLWIFHALLSAARGHFRQLTE